MQLAASSKSPEAVAVQMGRDPKQVAKTAQRLGISLKSTSKLKAKMRGYTSRISKLPLRMP
jgi:DNA-binding CsgD family transcriptional regulator